MTSETSWLPTWPWPAWSAVLLATVLASILVWTYWRDASELRGGWRFLLAAVRLLVVGLLVWMMFGWMVQRHRTEPADLVIAVDDSASMAFAFDDWEAAARSRINQLMPAGRETRPTRFEIARALLADSRDGWLQQFQQHYRVRLVLLADQVRELPAEDGSQLASRTPDRPASRLGAGLRSLLEAQRARPTAAIVVLSDGVTTDGPTIVDAAAHARQQSIPLYLVGMASAKPVRDLRLGDLLADDLVFVDDTLTVSCQLQATGLDGYKTRVRMTRAESDETLAEQEVTVTAGAGSVPVNLSYRAKAPGEFLLRVAVEPVEGEADVTNNQLVHSVRVRDSTLRILLVQGAPSYEFRYLKDLLSRATKPTGDGTEKAFDLTTVLQDADREWVDDEPSAAAVFPWRQDELFRFDVVILGDADPAFIGSAAAANLVDFVQEQGGGLVYMAGPRFLPLAYGASPLAKLLPFDLATVTQPAESLLSSPSPVRLTAVGQLLPQGQLVASSVDNARLWSQLPGLYWLLDIPHPSPGARVLVEHPARVDAQGRKLPVILLQYYGAGRIVFHATDETYRWARHAGRDDVYARYWLQTIRYLSRSKLLGDGVAAELTVDRPQSVFGEPVALRVQFRQAGAAPSAPDSVAVVLERDGGPRRQISLQPAPSQPALFTGTASDLAAGEYRAWLASPVLQPAPAACSFSVAPPTQEQSRRSLDAAELERAAEISRGRAYLLGQAGRLPGDLPRGQRMRVETMPPQPVWNSPVVAALFVGLLTVEWILRKRVGLL